MLSVKELQLYSSLPFCFIVGYHFYNALHGAMLYEEK